MKSNSSPGSKTSGTGSANGPANKIKPPTLLGNVLDSAPLKPLLTATEQAERQELETAIKSGWNTFLEVGSAVAKIRDKKLFRDKYETFDEYIKEVFGFSRPYAYNLIGSAEVYADLSSIEDIQRNSLRESQLRELISVPKEKRAAAWRGALKLAGGEPVTAKVVRQAAAEFKSKSGKPSKMAKAALAPVLDLQPAFKLIGEIEGMAVAAKNRRLLAKLKALRKCLLGLKSR